jgi:PAS domain S-box-containing protein
MTKPVSLGQTRLQLALEASAVGTWTSDFKTGDQVWDRRQYEMFGLRAGTPPTRQLFMSMVLPEDREKVEWNDEDLKPGARHFSEFRIRRPDGEIRWIAASSMVRMGPSAEPVELVGINWDITDNKNAELQLVEAERRLSLATRTAEIGIWDWNVETGAFFYSELARRIYGFSADETITFEGLKARTHPEDYEQVEPALSRALDPNIRSQETYRYRITKANTGEERWLLAHGGAVFSNDGPNAKPLRYTGTLQDITTEVLMDEALRDERARLELALGAGDLALWELDLLTGTVSHSPSLNRLYGFPEDATPSYAELASRYAPGENERLEAEAAQAMARGETSIRVEAKQLWPDGTTKWVAVRAQVFKNQEGVATRVIGVAMDVTERRRWEETLVATAAELQHRVKNTLAVVQSLARQTFGSPSHDEKTRIFFDRLQSLASATDLVTRNNWVTVPLGELVTEVIAPFGESNRFIVSGDGAVIASRDVTNLSLCLHELCTNAMKYGSLSNGDGRVRIEWAIDGEQVVLRWREEGGPPVQTPVRRGLGSKLLNSGVFRETGGNIELAFLPDGLAATIRLPARSGLETMSGAAVSAQEP